MPVDKPPCHQLVGYYPYWLNYNSLMYRNHKNLSGKYLYAMRKLSEKLPGAFALLKMPIR